MLNYVSLYRLFIFMLTTRASKASQFPEVLLSVYRAFSYPLRMRLRVAFS